MLAFFLESPVQLLFLGVVVLILFGPEKLPEMLNQVGRAIREFKRTTSDLSNAWNTEDRYDSHYDPPRYDSYGNKVYDSTYNTPVATIPAEDVETAYKQPAAIASSEMSHGDFAASALADTSEDYGVSSHAPAAPSEPVYGMLQSPAPQQVTPRPAEGTVPRQS